MATAADRPADKTWTCVPGDDGRWRCGQGEVVPETSPLPAMPDPAAADRPRSSPEAEPPREAPSIFILDRPTSQASPLQLPAPDPRGADAAPLGMPAAGGGFALKIASVSSVEEIAGFVSNFGLDPSLVRHVEIAEAGATRQVILWGAFSSPDQARRAIAGLPSVVRSVRPQIVRADGFDNRPRLLLDPRGSGTAAAPVASAATEAAPAVPPEPAPAVAETPTPAPSIAEVAIEPPTPAPGTGAADEAMPPTPEPSTVTAQARSPSTATPSTVTAMTGAPTTPDPGTAAVDPETPRATEPNAVVAVTGTPSAPEPSATAAEPEAPPVPEPTTVEAPIDPAAVTARTRPETARRSPAAATPPPGLGFDAFLALDGEAYTVQLSSLRTAALIGPYLSRHRLDPDRVYRFQLDEGAGPRWLLLWGAYPSLSAAEAGRDALPPSVRTPWVRRVGPLQRALGLQSRR